MDSAALLLFDVDGTLVLTGGAGSRGMARAFHQVFGVPDAFDGIPMPGRTDPQIVADALARTGIQADAAALAAFRRAYRECLIEELAKPPAGARQVMPGVRELLAQLRVRDRVFLSLLTGNYSEAAAIKLGYFGLWECFRGGAFGEDARERHELVPVAVARARAEGLPDIARDRVFVVGDTPLDVACARRAGVRSIAVAAGGTPAETLRASGAEVVFNDLTDTDAFLGWIGR